MDNTRIRFTRSATLLLLVTAALLMLSAGLAANEDAHDEAHEVEEIHHKHSLGIFGGITVEDGENLSTWGVEYTYRINKRWSVGGVIERADREADSTLGIIFAHYFPYKGLYIGGGVGRKDPGDARENTFRASIGYEFELEGGWALNPQINVDFIENHDEEKVYGIAFGKQF